MLFQFPPPCPCHLICSKTHLIDLIEPSSLFSLPTLLLFELPAHPHSDGDMGPSTDGSKLFTTLWSFFGVALIAAFISILSAHLVQAAALRKEIQKRKTRQQQLAHDDSSSSDDEEEDLEHNDDNDELISISSNRSSVILADNDNDNAPAGCCRCDGCSKKKCGTRVKYICSMFSPMLLVAATGIVVMMAVENISFVDALYWSVVTGTTVGYGDVSPQVPITRCFALFYLFAAIVTTGKALSAIGGVLEAKDSTQDKLLNRSLDENFLSSLDSGGDGDVSEFEYLTAMLVLLEYVEQDDIDRVMKSFRKLDRDGSKTLSLEGEFFFLHVCV